MSTPQLALAALTPQLLHLQLQHSRPPTASRGSSDAAHSPRTLARASLHYHRAAAPAHQHQRTLAAEVASAIAAPSHLLSPTSSSIPFVHTCPWPLSPAYTLHQLPIRPACSASRLSPRSHFVPAPIGHLRAAAAAASLAARRRPPRPGTRQGRTHQDRLSLRSSSQNNKDMVKVRI